MPLRFAPLLAALACAGFIAGCTTTPPDTEWRRRQASGLRDALVKLDERVDYEEAGHIAAEAVQKSVELSQQYRAVRPPWVHNSFVNWGLRERGLCYQWANDLFADLRKLETRTLTPHLAVARMDTRREHNAVVIIVPGHPFSDGLVLDPWRGSGRLWWGATSTDKYPWEPLPPERMDPSLKQFTAR